MNNNNYHVIIVGGGMVGLSLAGILSKNNFSVAIVENKKPNLNWDEKDLTARVSAIHLASQKLFSHLAVWKNIQASPLLEMHVWDHSGSQLHFDSADVGQTQLGWIVENRAIVKALWENLFERSCVDFFCPNKPMQLTHENNQIVLHLENKKALRADLVVGADGAHSWVREQMPINLKTRPYFHKAIVAVIESSKPHENCAYQHFLTTGPVALLPLANRHHSALVWSAEDTVSDDLCQQSESDFSEALTKALEYRLGKLTIQSQRYQFPLMMRHADDYVSENCALIGDAAHTIHPLAGQGANLGFMDAACLAQTLIDARDKKKSIGSLRTLRRYTRWRKPDNSVMIATMSGLKDAFELDNVYTNLFRNFGMSAINQCAPIKNLLINKAIGKSSDLPKFLQIE